MIVDNPSGCVNEALRGQRSCRECYYSQVNRKNCWTGSKECWNAECLVYRKEDK